MKNLFLSFMLLGSMVTFGQNLSLGGVSGTLSPVAPNEIFRFRPGNVTQLDTGGFGFTTNDRWFSLGRAQTFPSGNTSFGLRFQAGEKALLFGYQNVSQINPRIEWIGTGGNLGNLEFRSASSFTSTSSNLLATFTGDGRTIFGSTVPSPGPASSAKVSILSDKITGLVLQNALATNVRAGILVNISNSSLNNPSATATAINSLATCGSCPEFGVRGNTGGLGDFQYGIYGECGTTGIENWAGFFNGDVFVAGALINPSDAKFKENIKKEATILSKIEKLNPVSYNYIETKDINLAKGTQHGFIAQELEKVFPELTKDVTKPIFDKEGNVTSKINFKSVNYTGMISILTQAVKELNEEMKLLKSEISELKNNNIVTKESDNLEVTKGAILKQNIPNPFQDQTTIQYQLPNGSKTGELLITNLNGNLVKTIKLNPNEKEITVKSSEIGKGLFIYSLVSNGEALITKKMVVQ